MHRAREHGDYAWDLTGLEELLYIYVYKTVRMKLHAMLTETVRGNCFLSVPYRVPFFQCNVDNYTYITEKKSGSLHTKPTVTSREQSMVRG